jgi:hypothetical protein
MAKQQTAQPAQAAPLPGQFFDMPGIPGGATQYVEQDETSNNVVQVTQTAAQVQIQGIQPMRQTDVVTDWLMYLNVTQTYTAGTSTLTASAYAPANFVGAVKLLIQNQYASVDVESGIDLLIFNLIRPHSSAEIISGVNNGSNPAGSPLGGTATGYQTTALAQANQTNSAVWTSGSASYNLIFRLPAAQWFDKYFDLAQTGEPLTQPHPALVSPQYMAGTTRNITPTIMLAAGNSATTDLGPVNIGAGSGTYAGSANLRLRRKAIYAGNPASQPPVYAWQYRWKTTRQGVGGLSTFNVLMPIDTGQVLSSYLRFFDPAAAAGLGAPINVNTLTAVNFQYGSGLKWFDASTLGGTTAAELIQRRWFETHSTLLPAGVVALDFAVDDRAQVTNGRAFNTLTTSGLLWNVTFTAPLSATAYVVLGTESLVYVT